MPISQHPYTFLLEKPGMTLNEMAYLDKKILRNSSLKVAPGEKIASR
jgi:hypothetical protein